MYGKESLENEIPKKGVVSDCVMNMTVLRNEYKGGCILEKNWGRGVGVIQGG